MGCIKLHILNERYKSTELQVSGINKALTSDLGAGNVRRVMGYIYFGARYYDSELSIWLSVDPLASKYPFISPYAYCLNNPIRLIDPDGRDVYEFDENGKLLNQHENKNHDQIVIIGSDGQRKEGKQYDYGTIKNDFTKSVEQKDGNSVDVSFLKITGDKNAKESFEFVADNTNVEWSLTGVGTRSGDKGESYLSSSQESGRDGSANHLTSNNNIRYHIHNHPYRRGSHNPSESDCQTARNLYMKYGRTVPTSIYTGRRYHNYNMYTRMINERIEQILDSWKK